MEKQEALWAEYDRLIEAEDYEAAGRILDLIPPVSDEEWLKKLREAPMDDEPVSPRLRKKLDDLAEALGRGPGRQAG